jgi:DNA helicase-2/ATP-dependent DNA helicase PcrA
MSTSPPIPALAPEDEILAGLNDEQRECVQHGEGPLLVVAGAGTGKTQVITRRIAWLITSKRARPEQILALTFTEKAAAEMESRVDVLVPYGLVGATVATFNAFCDRLVRDHAVELGLTSQLRVESRAEVLVFLRERLFELGLDRYLPLGRPDEHLRALVAVFDRARNEDISPAAYRAFAERLLAGAGDDAVRRDRAEAEIEKARAYEVYERLLHEAGRVDFGSQIGLALRLLRERPYLRREYQERFRWVLVDEFQDTNHVQFELVKLLAGPPHHLTVVGDDDQSIYRFRGAKIENLLEFLDVFPSAKTVLLRRNYRSGQRILDFAHRLVKHNDPARLEAAHGFDKRLQTERRDDAGAPFEGSVEHRAFATASDEAETVAAEIADAIAAGRAAARDYAILARAHGHLDPFAAALQARGVRFRRVGMRGLYGRPEVQLCLNTLRTLADPDDGASLYMVLGDPLFGADPVDLARLGAASRKRRRGMLALAQEAATGGDTVAPATREAILRFSELHRRLAERAVRRPTSEVLYAFVTESGFLGTLTAEDRPENLERVQNLNKLFGIVTRVGPLLQCDRVNQFIPHLDLLIEMGDDPATAEVESDDDAVSLLTAHGAKGLEFPVVYLVHLIERGFPQYRRGEGLPFPPELRHAAGNDHEDHLREERRLFYVGMTRARDRLVLCYAADYGGKRAAKASRFVLEALALPALPKGARAATALESIERHAPTPETPASAIAPVPADQPVSLSHSAIDDYRTCPLKYFYAHVAHVPLAGDPTFMYGEAIHHAIKVWHQHRLKGLPIVADDVVAAFEAVWRPEGFLTPEHEARLFEQGRAALRRFVADDLASRRTPVAVEREFTFRIGNDLVSGRWDRIDERSEGLVLVDYKSSEVDDPEKADERAKESLRNGQLGLYALAHAEMYGHPPARVELYYVGPGVAGSADVEPEHLERARARIAEAAAGIRSAQFPPKPDQRNCGYCSYRQFCPHSAARGQG